MNALVTAADGLTCQVCGMAGPPLDPTCRDGLDHRVGTAAGCPYCGRLPRACARRPCFGSLHEAAMAAQLVRLQPAGAAVGHAARSGWGRPVTAGFDPATPNTARVYSCLLGGKDHFPADRGEAGQMLVIYPPLAEMVQENRTFIAEAVTWAAGQGFGQYLDLGAGLPAPPAVHQTARAVLPAARVAYIDTDPMVLSHARALLAGPGVAVVAADLRDPAAVLADPELRAVIDPAEPVCVILGAVLHFLDAGTARAVTAGYAGLIAPGSCLVISCAVYDDEALAKRLAAEYTAGQFVSHSREDVTSFFAGLELVGPGISEAQTWRAWMPEPVLRRRDGHVLAGVARLTQPAGAGSRSPGRP